MELCKGGYVTLSTKLSKLMPAPSMFRYKLLAALNKTAYDDAEKARLLGGGYHRRTQMDDVSLGTVIFLQY